MKYTGEIPTIEEHAARMGAVVRVPRDLEPPLSVVEKGCLVYTYIEARPHLPADPALPEEQELGKGVAELIYRRLAFDRLAILDPMRFLGPFWSEVTIQNDPPILVWVGHYLRHSEEGGNALLASEAHRIWFGQVVEQYLMELGLVQRRPGIAVPFPHGIVGA